MAMTRFLLSKDSNILNIYVYFINININLINLINYININ